MSEQPKKDPADLFTALQDFLAKSQQQFAEQVDVERKRRAGLSPDQRAAEDRQRALASAQTERSKIIKRYLNMGTDVLARESWTVAQFSWLLVGENPTKRGGWLDLEDDRPAVEQKKIRAVLESCVGVTLQPINPTAAPNEQRFSVGDLVRVAEGKRLGLVVLLKRILDRPGLPPTKKPGVTSEPPAPDSPKGTAPEWRGMLSKMLREIEDHETHGRIPKFHRDQLPWSLKTMYDVLALRHQAAGLGKLPVTADTLRKHLNKAHGWKAKRGYQDGPSSRRLREILKT